jgi:hypothetical protein
MRQHLTSWQSRLVIAAAIVMLPGCGQEMDEVERRSRERPAVVNLERVADWSLTMNGVPFKGNHHQVKVGEAIQFQGHLTPVDTQEEWKLPTMFRIVLRPSGQAREEWTMASVAEDQLELEVYIVQGKTDRKLKVSQDRVPPGAYDARLYYHRWDIHRANERSSMDLLGTARLTVLGADSNLQKAAGPMGESTAGLEASRK